MKNERELEANRSPYKEYKVKLKLVDRECLHCGESFQSEGFHNRMCNYCRRATWVDRTDDYPVVVGAL